MSLEIVVNGEARCVAPGTTLAELLAELGIVARHAAVEVNLELVPRARLAEQRLAAGDAVEVVTLVGGG